MRTQAQLLLAALIVVTSHGHHANADARSDDSGYRVLLPDRVELLAGKPGEISLILVPEEGFAIDRNGPLRIALLLPEASTLTLKKAALRRRDAIDPKSASPRFLVELRSATPGSYQLELHIRLWLCRGDVCRPSASHHRVPVEISQLSEPAPPTSADRAAST